MLPSRELHIYPNSRAIKQALEDIQSFCEILPSFMTIREFFQRVILLKDRKFIDEDMRILFLHRACDFSEFKRLHIPYDFISFFSTSNIIFSFLDELAQEKVELEEVLLKSSDESYKSDIKVFQKIKKNYIKILEEYGYCDTLTLTAIYDINYPFIKNFDKIVFHYPPYLQKFKQEIIDKIKNVVDIEFKEYSCDKQTSKVTISSFSQQILQVAYIKQKVYEYIKKGYLAERIAIILPDKELSKNLQNFDSENNFYFNFNKSFTDTYLYKKLNAIYLYLLDKKIENRYRIFKYFKEDDLEQILFSLKSDTLKFLKSLSEDCQKEEEIEIYQEELKEFEKIFIHIQNYTVVEIVHLFLNRLQKREIEDKVKKKIGVFDIFQTVGVDFDGVVIVDFNEDKVPKKIKNDLYLSSFLKKELGLPTILDKKRYEKELYKNLIYRAKEVAISYVDTQESRKSRFLDELNLTYQIKNLHPKKLSNLFFISTFQKESDDKKIVAYHDITKVKLSASKLKIFLNCKRRYYYQYIQELKEASLPTDEVANQDIGNTLHKVLEEIYQKKRYFYNEHELFGLIQALLYKRVKNPVEKFYIDMWLKRLPKFATQEVKRFREGFRVYQVERVLQTEYRGFRLYGKIDRIDIKDNLLYVLDYKSGKIPSTTKKEIQEKRVSDFQLQFYYLLSSTIKDTYLAYYYDLENAKLEKDNFFDEKFKLLDEILDTLRVKKEIEFDKTDDEKKCIYCPYKLICGRRV